MCVFFSSQHGSLDQMEQAELLKVDRENYWHAFTQMSEYEPLIVDRAEGVWLFDQQGRKLLDGVSSLWCNVHGHQHPRINAAIREQLDRVAHVTSLGMSNSTTLRLTQRLIDCTPDGLECVFYSSDGASAVEVALKQAFQYWRQCENPEPKRDLFLAIGNAYHGDTLGGVSVGGVSRFHAMFSPLLFDVIRGPCPDSYRVPEDLVDQQAGLAGAVQVELSERYLAEYRELVERFSDRIAAIIVEPLVQGAAGMVMHPPGFLRGLRELADEHSLLLIVDEIAMGMGRTGKMWACEWEDVAPDFLCTGKGLSGGYLPLAATITTRRIWDAFLGEYSESRSFFHGHTFGGNPLSCAAALACLEIFEEERTLQNVSTQAAYLARCLEAFQSHPHVGDIRQRGLVAAIELVSDRATRTGFPWAERVGHRVCEVAMQHGVWMRPLGNVIVIMPPLSVQREHIDLLATAVRCGLNAVLPATSVV